MQKVKNKTGKVIVIRTGRNSVDYDWFSVPAKGSIEVTDEQLKKIAQHVKNVGIKGISFSKRVKVKKQKLPRRRGSPIWKPIEEESKKA